MSISVKNVAMYLSASALVLASSGNARADGYAAAGCGLGSMIITQDGFVQIFAATTNGTSYNQTFAISSGTSNCDAKTVKRSVASYSEANRETLAREAARGEGETVTALSKLAECKDAASVGAALQASYAEIFPSAGTSDKSVGAAVLRTLEQSEALECKGLAREAAEKA